MSPAVAISRVPECLTGDGLVHYDFHPENVLVDARGTVTGIVDWDAASRGNGDFDLYTLRFDLARRAPALGRWLGGLLREALARHCRRTPALTPQKRCAKPRGQAAVAGGGPWLCRVRPCGLVMVVVPSAFSRISHPHRWIRIRW